MPASRRGAALVALTTCLLLAAAPGARAEELLVMPYACTVHGGVPVLTRAPEQGYRVIGRREQRRFTACSPVNPDLCRNWTVHRFDLDCDGSRVPWVSVVAAADERNRRAWLMVGRLHVRMGPRWSLPPDDPCAQEAGREGRFAYRRFRRHCADRLAMAPPPVVEMPFGFAPMLGIDGIFVKAAPGIGATAGPFPPIAAGPPPAEEVDGGGTRRRMPSAEAAPFPWLERDDPGAEGDTAEDGDVEPRRRMPLAEAAPFPWLEREPAAKDERAASPPPASAEVADPPPSGKTKPATTPVPEPRGSVPPKAAPRTAADAPPPPANDTPKAAPAEPKPAPKVAAAPQPPPPAPKELAAPDTVAEPADTSVTINPFSVLRGTTLGAIAVFAGLALGLLIAFALARRREGLRHAGMGPRDIASVSLRGGRAKPMARPGPAHGRPPPAAPAPAPRRPPSASVAVAALADRGDRMPATRAEAFQVLGVGVTPDATEVAIKKIVDGLRMSWHPDFAKDETDRQLRELRSKQINAAWEVLQRQRAEA